MKGDEAICIPWTRGTISRKSGKDYYEQSEEAKQLFHQANES